MRPYSKTSQPETKIGLTLQEVGYTYTIFTYVYCYGWHPKKNPSFRPSEEEGWAAILKESSKKEVS